MQYDSNLKKIKDQLNGISAGSFSAFISSSQTAFSDIKSAMSSLGDFSSVWKDQVATEYQNTIANISSLTESCEQFATGVVEPLSNYIPSLDDSIRLYLEAVDKYNNLEDTYNSISVGAKPNESDFPTEIAYNTACSNWSSASNNKNDARGRMLKQGITVNELIIECYSSINIINGILGGDIVAIPSISSIDGLTIVEDTQNNNGNTIKTYSWIDEDGNTVREDYTILNPSNQVIEKGSVDYYENGRKKEYTIFLLEEKQFRNITEKYEGDFDHEVLRYKSIDKIESDGYTEYGIEENYNEYGKLTTRTTKKAEGKGFVQLDITETYDAKEKLIETSMGEVRHEDGTVEKNIHNDLENDITTIEEITYVSGVYKSKHDIYIDEKNQFERYGRIESSSGIVEEDVYVEYDLIDTDSGKEKYTKSRTIDSITHPNGETQEAVYEEWNVEATPDGEVNNYMKSQTINKVEYSDGEVQQELYLEYDSNKRLVSSSIGKVTYSDGREKTHVEAEYDSDGHKTFYTYDGQPEEEMINELIVEDVDDSVLESLITNNSEATTTEGVTSNNSTLSEDQIPTATLKEFPTLNRPQSTKEILMNKLGLNNNEEKPTVTKDNVPVYDFGASTRTDTPTPASGEITVETAENRFGNTRQREKHYVEGPPVEITATPMNDDKPAIDYSTDTKYTTPASGDVMADIPVVGTIAPSEAKLPTGMPKFDKTPSPKETLMSKLGLNNNEEKPTITKDNVPIYDFGASTRNDTPTPASGEATTDIPVVGTIAPSETSLPFGNTRQREKRYTEGPPVEITATPMEETPAVEASVSPSGAKMPNGMPRFNKTPSVEETLKSKLGLNNTGREEPKPAVTIDNVPKYDFGTSAQKDTTVSISDKTSTPKIKTMEDIINDVKSRYTILPNPKTETSAIESAKSTLEELNQTVTNNTNTTIEESSYVNNLGNTRQREKKYTEGPPVEIKATPMNEEKPATTTTTQTSSTPKSKIITVNDDLNNHFAMIKDMPYNEEGRKDAMLAYIQQQYGASDRVSEVIYNKWLQNSK